MIHFVFKCVTLMCQSESPAHCFVKCCCSSSAQIQKMKNAVPKNDKKKRKQMTEEIAKLEANLSQRHEEELTQLTPDNKVAPRLSLFILPFIL